jgi:RNA polymerase sigma-70 factor (ECF subfamily)
MSFSNFNPDLNLLCREAEAAAARLVRQYHLPHDNRDDLRQSLLVDLISRLKSFDPTRGTLGAFAGTVLAHRAARLAMSIKRERLYGATTSLDSPLAGSDDLTLGDTLGTDKGYSAWQGQPTDDFGAIDRRLDLDRALGTLNAENQKLCFALVRKTPAELSRDGHGGRATVYRRIREIRLQLLAVGVATS